MYVVLIVGLSGSGKSTLAKIIAEYYKSIGLITTIVSQDDYYKACPNLTDEEISMLDFESPDQIDFDLLLNNLSTLRKGGVVSIPFYEDVNSKKKINTRNRSSTAKVSYC